MSYKSVNKAQIVPFVNVCPVFPGDVGGRYEKRYLFVDSSSHESKFRFVNVKQLQKSRRKPRPVLFVEIFMRLFRSSLKIQ